VEPKNEDPILSPAKKMRSDLSFLIDDDDIEISKVEPPLSNEELICKEIEMYKCESKVLSCEDPLKFWKGIAVRLPRLSRLVKYYLCVQASSVASERIFSTAGDIVTATRSCLDPQCVDQLIFLKKNFNETKDIASILHNM
jgi:hypothetical protein